MCQKSVKQVIKRKKKVEVRIRERNKFFFWNIGIDLNIIPSFS